MSIWVAGNRLKRSGGLLCHLPQIALALEAIAVLIGWQFGIEHLKRIMPQWVAMNPTTAVSMLLASVALTLSVADDRLPRGAGQIGRLLAILIAAFGIVNLIAILGGPDLHADQLLYDLRRGALPSADQAMRLNRIAPNTALLFVLFGIAIAICRLKQPAFRFIAKSIAVIGSLIALVAAVGYFNGVVSLYRPTALTPMALHSAFGFLLLATGLLLSDRGSHPGVDLRDERLSDLSAVHRKITIGFGAALFVLALIGLVSYASIQSFAAAAHMTERTRQVLGAISDFANTLSEIEDAKNGYVVTGHEMFSVSYYRDKALVPAEIEQIRSLTDDDVAQQTRLAALCLSLQKVFSTFEDMMQKRHTLGMAAVQQAMDGDPGSKAFSETESIVSDMRACENKLQDIRAKETDRSDNVTTIVITSGILIAFVLVGLAGSLIRRDLSHKQEVAKELRIARLAADAANESKSEFLANMSHEIRTPMAAVIGYADLLLDPSHGAAERLDFVNTIRRNGEHLLNVINDILDLSKIDAGKFQIDRVTCSPCSVLSDVASMMRVRASERGLKLDIRNEGPVPVNIQTDPSRLRQILINLVGNAIKFTDEGWVRVIMKLDEPDGTRPRLCFDVIDTGIGMTGDQVSQLFQPFVQVDASSTRRFGGTGLGLTICKRLAEMLGGEIRVDTALGRGSTFAVIVDPGPLENVRRVAHCCEALAGSAQSLGSPVVTGLRGRVLLVDDGEDNRRLLSFYLSQAGIDVTLAENGRIAIEKAMLAAEQQNPFDIILMDMQMPILDGYGAAALLRQQGYMGPIIALTANAMVEDSDKCLKAGCTAYLSKPVRRDHLLLTIARYVTTPCTVTAASRADSADLKHATMSPSSTVPADYVAIRSDLTEEALQPHLLSYINCLPERISRLESTMRNGDLEQLSTEIHNLKGTGGLYGLMPITDAATKVESLLTSAAAIGAIHEQVRELIELVRRVEGFSHSVTKRDLT